MAKRDGKDRQTKQRLSVVSPPDQAGDSDIRNRYNEEVRWEILLLEPVNDWFLALCMDDPLRRTRYEEREAIVLVAGDKAGRWSAWYVAAVPLAEKRYAAYRRELREEEE